MKLKLFMAVLALAVVALPDLALAQSTGGTGTGAGSSLKADIVDVFKGDIGFLVGLGVSVFGLYMWLIKQASWGLVMLIAGGLITVFPNLFKGIQEGAQGAFGDTVGTTNVVNPE